MLARKPAWMLAWTAIRHNGRCRKRSVERSTVRRRILNGYDRLPLQVESLERRQLLAGDLVISEFLASNDNGLEDEEYERPDWVEILNAGDAPADLDGWFLTDDEDDLDRWRFPAVSLAPRERLVVFASGKDRIDPSGPLHTNFALNKDADYLALVQPDGVTVAHDYGLPYPPQVVDVSFGMAQAVSDLTLVEAGSAAQTIVPLESNGGSQLSVEQWATPGFDDTSWSTSPTPVGYERSDGYQDLLVTDLESEMFNQNTSVYMRHRFTLDEGQARGIFSMTLSMQFEDGFVAYINGQEVARFQAPDDVTWNSAATDNHSDRDADDFTQFPINVWQHSDLLRPGQNVLAIHALNDVVDSSDFLMNAELTASSAATLRRDALHYFPHPTPGQPNDVASRAAIISASHSPNVPAVGEAINVSASTWVTAGEIANVTLHYRVMFGDEVMVPMRDDGQSGDGLPGDGIYGATIPAGVAQPGEMVRYRVTATTDQGGHTRLPVFYDPLNTEQYFGTVVQNPNVDSDLKVIELFFEEPEAKNTTQGTQGALFHDGKFYDNIFVDTHGRSVGLSGPEKSHDIFFTSDHWFELEEDGEILRMNDFDIITDYWNRAKVRVAMGYQTFNNVGTPAHLSFNVRIQENGEFYGTYFFVDGGNERFLQRAGLDPGGALYKMNLDFSTARGAFKKQTREFEDFTDLREFFRGLRLSGEERRQFLMDNVNIPAMVNYLVGMIIMGHGDCCGKNLYIYRDTEGSKEWEAVPWDVDSAFGRGGVAEAKSVFPTAAGLFTGRDNSLIDALFEDVPGFREMYLRRARSLMDEFLQPPDTQPGTGRFEQRIDEIVAQIGNDGHLDNEKWGTWVADETGKIFHDPELVPTWQEEVDALKFDYFPARREFLYNSLRNANGGEQLPPQTSSPPIRFGEVQANPASGNQDEEYLQLTNPTDTAVDLSGWRLTGGIEHTLKPGTVLVPGETLYLTPNINAFRARATGPSGGQSLFVQGNYTGHLSNHGSQVQLVGHDGSVVDRLLIEADPAPVQQFLRVSEIMFHPRVDPAERRFEDDDFEFIEFVNTSTTEEIDLQHVRVTSGVEFSFPAMTLAPGERTLVVRDLAGFRQRYGDELNVAGEYGRTQQRFRLSNGGELVRIEIGTGDLVQEFSYDDAWYPAADGPGHSLVIVDPTADVARWNHSDAWTISSQVDGSPGRRDGVSIDGDLNGDGLLNVDDIDLFCAGVQEGNPEFDINNDAVVDQFDMQQVVQDAFESRIGDANLDGQFDSSDLVQIFEAGQYEDAIPGNSTWASGDWNCDGEFTSSDIVFAFQVGIG